MNNLLNSEKRCYDCIYVKESLKDNPCKNCHSKEDRPNFTSKKDDN